LEKKSKGVGGAWVLAKQIEWNGRGCRNPEKCNKATAVGGGPIRGGHQKDGTNVRGGGIPGVIKEKTEIRSG